MNKLFPVIKHVSIPNLLTSAEVVLALGCQVLVIKGGTGVGLTVFLFVLILNKIGSELPENPGQVAEFGNELRSLSEFLCFIVTPIVISYYMGFNGVYSYVCFALYLFSGIWRSADFNQTGTVYKNNRSCFRGLCLSHAGALFLMTAAVNAGFLSHNSILTFIPFFIMVSPFMLSSLLYNKKGKLAITFYILASVSIILMWL